MAFSVERIDREKTKNEKRKTKNHNSKFKTFS